MKKRKRKDREGKTSVFIKRDESYIKFKEKVKEKGLNINRVFELFVKKVANGEIDLLDLLK